MLDILWVLSVVCVWSVGNSEGSITMLLLVCARHGVGEMRDRRVQALREGLYERLGLGNRNLTLRILDIVFCG